MVECFEFEIKSFYNFIYIMVPIPEGLEEQLYKYKHEIIFSKVMKQLKTYGVNTLLIVSLEFLEWIF